MVGMPVAVIDPIAPPSIPYGLFNVATGPMDLPVHGEQAGLTYLADSCGRFHLYPAPCNTIGAYPSLILDNIEGLTSAYPFVVYGSEVTGAVGLSNEDAARRARVRLVLNEQRAAESALWQGNAAENVTGIFQQLNTAGVVTTLGPASTVKDALSRLEQWAATNYVGPAIIHARPRIAAYAAASQLIRVLPPTQRRAAPAGPQVTPGTVLPGQDASLVPTQLTQAENYWLFGNGYDGTGPAGQAVVDGTTEYMFVTGRVLVWRSEQVEISAPEAIINRNTNQRGLYAFRNYAIAVECAIACVQVTLA